MIFVIVLFLLAASDLVVGVSNDAVNFLNSAIGSKAAPFRVIMHLLDIPDQLKAINNVFDHLKQGGRFIFDVFNPDLKHLIHGLNNVKDFEAEYQPGKLFKRYSSTNPDLVNQIIEVTFKFWWEDDEGEKGLRRGAGVSPHPGPSSSGEGEFLQGWLDFAVCVRINLLEAPHHDRFRGLGFREYQYQ